MNKKNNGFTLPELIVVIAIATVLMSVVLFGYSSFNNNLSVSSASQEMAINIREAQAYGLNVRQTSVDSGRFDSAYGVYFNPSSNPNDYVIFVDTNSNSGDQLGRYDEGSGCGSSSTECIQKVILRDGVTISSVCNDDVSESLCAISPSIESMHIIFKRPDPDAVINFANSGDIITVSSQLVGKVYLLSKSGDTSSVVIKKTGQILTK